MQGHTMTVLTFLNAAGFIEREGKHVTLGVTFCFMLIKRHMHKMSTMKMNREEKPYLEVEKNERFYYNFSLEVS